MIVWWLTNLVLFQVTFTAYSVFFNAQPTYNAVSIRIWSAISINIDLLCYNNGIVTANLTREASVAQTLLCCSPTSDRSVELLFKECYMTNNQHNNTAVLSHLGHCQHVMIDWLIDLDPNRWVGNASSSKLTFSPSLHVISHISNVSTTSLMTSYSLTHSHRLY